MTETMKSEGGEMLTRQRLEQVKKSWRPEPNYIDGLTIKDAEWLMSTLEQQLNRNDELVVALKEAISLIRTWHGMGMDEHQETEMWKLYQASPEMKRLNEVLFHSSN